MISLSVVNRRASWKLAKRFGMTFDVLTDYASVVASHARPELVIVDVGGGKQCQFAALSHGSRIIAVDVSEKELSHNHDVWERRVCDATVDLPFADNSVDVVASCAVVEHMDGVAKYVGHAHRVLAPKGVFVTAFPNKYALSSVLNRLVPRSAVRWALRHLFRDVKERCGFPAYYQHCTPRAFKKLLQSQGFEIVEARVSYFQSDYYGFFLPIFVVSLAWDWFASKIGEPLCAACLIVARKPDEHSSS
jgi:ubiquinone/menaquinone biosynthesis C-methylase UbiE